jgi:hypothetical protein
VKYAPREAHARFRNQKAGLGRPWLSVMPQPAPGHRSRKFHTSAPPQRVHGVRHSANVRRIASPLTTRERRQ